MPIPSRPVPTRIASQGGHPPSRASEPSSTNPTPLPHVPVPYVHVKTPQSGKYEETAPSIPDYQGQPPHVGKYDTTPRDTRLNDAPPPEPSRWESERLTPQVAQLPHDYVENPRRYSTGFAGDAGLGRREGYFEENSMGPPQRARGEFSRFQPTHGRNQNSSEELRRASIGVPRDAYAQVGWASQPEYPDVNSAAQAASASADRAVAAARAAAALAKNNKYGNLQSSDSSVQRNAQVPNHNTAAHDTDEYTSLSEDDYGVQSHAMGNRANGMASVREGEDSDETEEEEVVLPYKERVTRQPGTGLMKPKSSNGNNWNSEFQKSHGSDGEDSKEGSRGRLTGRRKEKHPVVDDVDRHSHRSPEFEENYAGDIRPRSLPEKKSKPPVEDYDKRDRRHSQNFEYEEQVERARVVKEAPAGRRTRSKPVADEYVNRERRQSGAGEEFERAPPRKGKPKPSDIRTSKSEPHGSTAFDDEEGSRGKVTSRKNSRLVAEGYAEEYRTSASHGFDKERDQVRKWDEVPSKGFRSKGKPLHDEVPEVVRTSNTDYHESVSGRSWEESGLSYKDNIRRSKSDGKPGKAKTSFQENGYRKSDYQSHGSEDDAILPSGRDLHWTKSADDYQSGDLRRSNKSEEYDDEEGPLGRGPGGRMLKPRENEHQDSDSRQLHGYDDEYRSPTEASRKSRKGMKNSQLDDNDMVEPKIFSAPALFDEPEDTNFLGSLKEEKSPNSKPSFTDFYKNESKRFNDDPGFTTSINFGRGQTEQLKASGAPKFDDDVDKYEDIFKPITRVKHGREFKEEDPNATRTRRDRSNEGESTIGKRMSLSSALPSDKPKYVPFKPKYAFNDHDDSEMTARPSGRRVTVGGEVVAADVRSRESDYSGTPKGTVERDVEDFWTGKQFGVVEESQQRKPESRRLHGLKPSLMTTEPSFHLDVDRSDQRSPEPLLRGLQSGEQQAKSRKYPVVDDEAAVRSKYGTLKLEKQRSPRDINDYEDATRTPSARAASRAEKPLKFNSSSKDQKPGLVVRPNLATSKAGSESWGLHKAALEDPRRTRSSNVEQLSTESTLPATPRLAKLSLASVSSPRLSSEGTTTPGRKLPPNFEDVAKLVRRQS